MSSDYNYDADAQYFPFFVLTITSIVTLPLTFTLLRSPSDAAAPGKNDAVSQITTPYQPAHADIIDAQRAKQKRKELRLKRIVTAGIGWLVMAYMVYLMVVTARSAPKIWSPYDLLDISLSATEKQINSRYRKLSTTMHPDKRKPNPALNETLDTINNEWVEIVKAYKALTDEETRRNYELYGNPDGKQSTSFGIALPQFLVADGSGKFVLAFYGLLLGIGLPWLVGKWWYGMQKMTRERILVTSAGGLFREFKEQMEPADVAAGISAADEFKEILGGVAADDGLGKLENRLQAVVPAKYLQAINNLEDPARRKALALIWAYVTRQDLDDRSLESEKYEVAPTALQLNEAFLSMSLAFGFSSPVISSYHVSQCLTQAIPFHKRYPLLQLPHFTPTIVESIEKGAVRNSRAHLTVQAFMALPKEQRQSLGQAAGLSTDQLQVAENVARQLPRLQIEKTFFKVQGEKYLLPSSLVQFVIKARVIPPGTTNIPPVNEKDLLDIDPAEGDLKAQKIEQEQHYSPLAYAPFYAKDRAPRYHAFLADSRMGKVAVPPFSFISYDVKPFETDAQGNLKPTFNMITLKMQFQAPPQAGEYKFQLRLYSDSYLGFDETREAIMLLEDASKAQEVEEDDDISEPEEDSLAGQMAAMKGQATGETKRPRNPRKSALVDEESDYESGTDEDVDTESETDTETDTDGE